MPHCWTKASLYFPTLWGPLLQLLWWYNLVLHAADMACPHTPEPGKFGHYICKLGLQPRSINRTPRILRSIQRCDFIFSRRGSTFSVHVQFVQARNSTESLLNNKLRNPITACVQVDHRIMIIGGTYLGLWRSDSIIGGFLVLADLLFLNCNLMFHQNNYLTKRLI